MSESSGNFDPHVHVPGLWRCAKCQFRLIQSTLNDKDGTVTARDEAGVPCPNCAVPLWRVTWREEAEDARKSEETIWERGFEAGKRHSISSLPCGLCALGFTPFKAERILWHQVNGRDPFRCTSPAVGDSS